MTALLSLFAAAALTMIVILSLLDLSPMVAVAIAIGLNLLAVLLAVLKVLHSFEKSEH